MPKATRKSKRKSLPKKSKRRARAGTPIPRRQAKPAGKPPIVNVGAPTQRNTALARAFLDLEPLVHDVRAAAALLEITSDDIIIQAQGASAERIKAALPEFSEYDVRVWTEVQVLAIEASIWRVIELANKLRSQWHSGFDAAPAPAT